MTAYDEGVWAVREGELEADAAADQLIGRMTDRELLRLLDGDSPGWLLTLIPWLLGRRPFGRLPLKRRRSRAGQPHGALRNRPTAGADRRPRRFEFP
jgi:hypothetical protein